MLSKKYHTVWFMCRMQGKHVLLLCCIAVTLNVVIYNGVSKKEYEERWTSRNGITGATVPTDITHARNLKVLQRLGNIDQPVSSPHEGMMSAFQKGGYAYMDLMQPTQHPRPLDDFTLLPWKTQTNWTDSFIWNTLHQTINWSMIVVVKSHSHNFKRRKVVRETWGSFKYLNGVRLEIVFVVGRANNNESAAALLDESRKHGDILQVDKMEIYNYLGLKTIAGMQWVSQNVPQHWIYTSSDDDMLPDLPSLYKDLEKLMLQGLMLRDKSKVPAPTQDGGMFSPDVLSHLPIHCGYKLGMGRSPDRGDRKWSIDRATYPLKRYPRICFGGWNSMPVSMASGIYDTSRHHKLFRLEDVWITGLLRLSYFHSIGAKGYFGRNVSDELIGLWPEAPNVVSHCFNERHVLQHWKELGTTFLANTTGFIRVVSG